MRRFLSTPGGPHIADFNLPIMLDPVDFEVGGESLGILEFDGAWVKSSLPRFN